MRAIRLTAVLATLPLLAGTGCRMNERMTGTAGGALAGGVLGGVAAGTVGGVLIGTAGGALVGYLIGDYLADQTERCMTPTQGGGCGVPQSQAYARPPAAQPYAAQPYAAQPYVVPDEYAEARAASLTAPVTPAAPRPDTAAAWAARSAYERGRSAATADEARAAYAEAIRLDPSRPEPYNALALHALVTGDRATARAQLTKALAADPTYAPARLNLQRLDRGE